jgi:hypothetical protein
MGSLGVRTVYSDQNGQTATFTLADVKTDADRIELVTPGGGDKLDDCRNTSKFLYASQDRGYEFTMEFAQLVFKPGDPVDQQWLLVAIETINPNDRNASQDYYSFRLDRLTNPPQPIGVGGGLSTDYASRYDATSSIDGVTYTDVLEATWASANPRRLEGANPPPEANWLRVVIARNIGLVQFETADGRVFTRSAGP